MGGGRNKTQLAPPPILIAATVVGVLPPSAVAVLWMVGAVNIDGPPR